METARSGLRYFLIPAGLLLLLIAGVLFKGGRLAVFHTASISSYGLSSATELYQDRVLWLSGETEVRQDFVARYPGLFQVGVFLTGQKRLERDVKLFFHLKRRCDSPTNLREVVVVIPRDVISDRDLFYPFTFVPIDESTNQHFCFILEPLLAAGEETFVGVWASTKDVYLDGELYYQSPKVTADAGETSRQAFAYKIFLPIIQRPALHELENDVGFQLHYNGRLLDTIAVFLFHLSEHKPYFWGQPGFYILLLVVYGVAFYLLIRIRPF